MKKLVLILLMLVFCANIAYANSIDDPWMTAWNGEWVVPFSEEASSNEALELGDESTSLYAMSAVAVLSIGGFVLARKSRKRYQ